jgi:hypothetical protein
MAAADAAALATPPPAEKPGVLSRIVDWFSPFDSGDKPRYEVVIPTSEAGAKQPAPAASPAGAAEPADKAAANAGADATATQAAGAAAAEPAPTRSNRLEIFYESPDDPPAEKPEAKPAEAGKPAP